MKKNKISLMDVAGQYERQKVSVHKAIERVLASGRYIMGPEVREFEKNFAAYLHAKQCIGVSSGTDALIFALRALGIGEGDEVITVPNTFVATAEAIALTGAKIVLCDVDMKTKNMDPQSLSQRITKRTKAVIPVHLHGNPVDMDAIYKITKPRGIAVIEDACQAHGALYKGKMIGALESEFACFSFHPVKNIGAYGDAGAITTKSKRLADWIRLYINHGRVNHVTHSMIGTTGRIDTLQAAILDVRLRSLPDYIKHKREIVKAYKERLKGYCEYIDETPFGRSAHHVFAILTPERKRLALYLEEKGIETGMHYPVPLHLQKAYMFLGYKKGTFPVSEDYAAKTLSLPLFPHMTHEQVKYVTDSIVDFYEKKPQNKTQR